jgi:hypothetical protein
MPFHHETLIRRRPFVHPTVCPRQYLDGRGEVKETPARTGPKIHSTILVEMGFDPVARRSMAAGLATFSR